jgi:DNA-directed RNA polymerase specialized sigma24 family protein
MQQYDLAADIRARVDGWFDAEPVLRSSWPQADDDRAADIDAAFELWLWCEASSGIPLSPADEEADEAERQSRRNSLGWFELQLRNQESEIEAQLYERAGLSPRERFAWTAQDRGLIVNDIGAMLNVNGETAEVYLRRARKKIAAVA